MSIRDALLSNYPDELEDQTVVDEVFPDQALKMAYFVQVYGILDRIGLD